MRPPARFLGSILVAAWLASEPPCLEAQVCAFEIEGEVAVVDLGSAGEGPRKLAPGTDPAISPDGRAVAFTRSDEDGNRFIAVVDVASGQWKTVEGIPGDNSYLPIWTPDGSSLVFRHFLGSEWALARADAGGGNFSLLKQAGREAGACGFLPDGSALVCHDLSSFFALTLEGKVTALPVARELPGLSIPSRVSVSPDGERALFELLEEDDMGPDDEGPPSAIHLLTLATGEVRRVTPKGFNAMHPAWLPGGAEFLFAAYDFREGEFRVYRSPADGSAPPLLVLRNASAPTAASR